MSRRYRISGIVIESNLPLEELPETDSSEVAVCVELRPRRSPPITCNWFRSWVGPAGEVCGLFGRSGDGYLLRFEGKADFFIRSDGRTAVCEPADGFPGHSLRHLLLDQVLPVMLSRQGAGVFHASAVRIGDSVAAFLGLSGRGKSTIAGYLALQGHPLVTDDCLVLIPGASGFDALPFYPGVRLWGESIESLAPAARLLPRVSHYSDKLRMGTLPFCETPAPLGRIYLLDSSGNGDVEILPRRGPGLVRDLLAGSFLLDTEDPVELQASFDVVSHLAGSGMCFDLRAPRDLARLPEFAEKVVEHVTAGRGKGGEDGT